MPRSMPPLITNIRWIRREPNETGRGSWIFDHDAYTEVEVDFTDFPQLLITSLSLSQHPDYESDILYAGERLSIDYHQLMSCKNSIGRLDLLWLDELPQEGTHAPSVIMDGLAGCTEVDVEDFRADIESHVTSSKKATP